MSDDYCCPACDEAGSFVEEYQEWYQEPGPGRPGVPDYASQVMECTSDDCPVLRFDPNP